MIWKDIIGFEGIYQVSNTGQVKALSRLVVFAPGKRITPERIMKLSQDRNGYLRAHLSKDGVSKFYAVHRLVAIHFCANEQNKVCVNHKDRDRKNNNDWNLEWATHRENTHHYRLHTKKSLPIGVGLKKGRFQAKYRVGQKYFYLGLHETPELAKAAFDLAISKL